MNSVTAINIIRDNLRTNLTDPIVTAGGNARGGSYWIFANEPIVTNKFPQIELLKIDNPTEVLDIGPTYTERERIFVNVWIKSKNGFKITVDGVEYKNAQLVEYYLGLVKTTLKSQFSTLFDADVKGYRHVNTTGVEYDPNTQLYFGAVTITAFYFNT